MTIYLDRGPFLTIPDKLHPGQYRVIRNPDWHEELPEIVSFTDFLKWNYTLEYGQYIRKLHYYHQLPLPWGVLTIPWMSFWFPSFQRKNLRALHKQSSTTTIHTNRIIPAASILLQLQRQWVIT